MSWMTARSHAGDHPPITSWPPPTGPATSARRPSWCGATRRRVGRFLYSSGAAGRTRSRTWSRRPCSGPSGGWTAGGARPRSEAGSSPSPGNLLRDEFRTPEGTADAVARGPRPARSRRSRTPSLPRRKPSERVRRGSASLPRLQREVFLLRAQQGAIRRDRRGAGHHARCGTGALPSRGQTPEGAGSMSDCTACPTGCPTWRSAARAGPPRRSAISRPAPIAAPSGRSCPLRAGWADARRDVGSRSASPAARSQRLAADRARAPAKEPGLDGRPALAAAAVVALAVWTGRSGVGSGRRAAGRAARPRRGGPARVPRAPGTTHRAPPHRRPWSWPCPSSTACPRRRSTRSSGAGRTTRPGGRRRFARRATTVTSSSSRCSPDWRADATRDCCGWSLVAVAGFGASPATGQEPGRDTPEGGRASAADPRALRRAHPAGAAGSTTSRCSSSRATVGTYASRRRDMERASKARSAARSSGSSSPGSPRRPDSVARLTEELWRSGFDTPRASGRSRRELSTYLDPVQRARLILLRDRLVNRGTGSAAVGRAANGSLTSTAVHFGVPRQGLRDAPPAA